jgi:hypothetical protein
MVRRQLTLVALAEANCAHTGTVTPHLFQIQDEGVPIELIVDAGEESARPAYRGTTIQALIPNQREGIASVVQSGDAAEAFRTSTRGSIRVDRYLHIICHGDLLFSQRLRKGISGDEDQPFSW